MKLVPLSALVILFTEIVRFLLRIILTGQSSIKTISLILLTGISLVFYVIMLFHGFVKLGSKTKNSLLVITSYMTIGVVALVGLTNIPQIYSFLQMRNLVLFISIFLLSIGFLFGISLFALSKKGVSKLLTISTGVLCAVSAGPIVSISSIGLGLLNIIKIVLVFFLLLSSQRYLN